MTNTPNRQLLFSVTAKHCNFEALRTSKGAGGQKRDKTFSAIRCTHPPSGAVGYCQDHREQGKNKREAFLRMVKTKEFEVWRRIKAAEMLGKPTIDELVDEQMQAINLRVDVVENGKWTQT